MDSAEPAPEPSQESPAEESFSIEYRIPDESNIDMVFANVLQTSFAGDFFMFTLAQAAPKVMSNAEDIERATGRVHEARVVGRFAIPVSTFLAQVGAINKLLERLERRGVLRASADEEEEGGGDA